MVLLAGLAFLSITTGTAKLKSYCQPPSYQSTRKSLFLGERLEILEATDFFEGKQKMVTKIDYIGQKHFKNIFPRFNGELMSPA